MYVPIMWFTQVADLPKDLADSARSGIEIIGILETVARISFWVFIGVGALFIIVGITLCFTQRNSNKNKNVLQRT